MLSQWNVQLQSGTNHRLHMGNDRRSRRHIILRYRAVTVSGGITWKAAVNWAHTKQNASYFLPRLGFPPRTFKYIDSWISGYTSFMLHWDGASYFVSTPIYSMTVILSFLSVCYFSSAVQLMPFDFSSRFHIIIISGLKLKALYPDNVLFFSSSNYIFLVILDKPGS